jgi:DNA adenine methylase
MTKNLVAPNVALVPLYSPFRYPGGKSRLYPFIVKWLESRPVRPKALIEPFAGGAHVGLAAVIEGMVSSVLLVEIDADVASVWKTILSEECKWLVERILTFEMSEDAAEEILEREKGTLSLGECAFRVILRNRVSRGGVIAPGSGRLDYGESGRGLHSRWYPDTLRQRIMRISMKRDRIKFIEGDGLAVMRDNRNLQSAVFFVDPPYPRTGRRLYRHSDVEPEEVFEVVCSLAGDFLMTYDDSGEIGELVEKYELDVERIQMSTSHHRAKYELMISRDLSWLL